jgi:hypothetical protein
MKRYNTPALVEVGRVVDLTLGAIPGGDDGDGVQQLLSVGSVGFNL